MKEMGVRKEPGCCWIEHGDEVHKFLSGDASHPQSKELHEYFETLSQRKRKEGYVPDTSCVLHNVDDEEKETMLCGHSERLAIAFGLLNTLPGTTIRVAKNLRVCNDCHVATKIISKIVDSLRLPFDEADNRSSERRNEYSPRLLSGISVRVKDKKRREGRE